MRRPLRSRLKRWPSGLGLAALLGAALVPSAAAPALAAPEEHPCLGRWVGSARNGGSLPWAIDLTLTSTAGACGRIDYDSSELDCGGPLQRCVFGDGAANAAEHYDHNRNCSPPGRLDLRCEGDVMEWEWRGWESVRTTLRRVAPAAGTTGPSPSAQPPGQDPGPGQEPAERPGPPPGPEPTHGSEDPPEAPDPGPPQAIPGPDAASGCACGAAPGATRRPRGRGLLGAGCWVALWLLFRRHRRRAGLP